ncbi:eukaryotic translation initiation factor 5A [Fusarium avenaceum]|nr:eukaryotic translation initiation factor 5A [Fusarium avenaceum]
MSDDESNSSVTYSMSPSELRKNGHVVINGRPCKIVEIEASQSTISLDGIDIFTGQLHKCTLSTDEDVDVPNVTRDEYMLVNIDDGFLNLESKAGDPKDDVKVPGGDIGTNLSNDFESGKDLLVTVQQAMGEEEAMSYKEVLKGHGY